MATGNPVGTMYVVLDMDASEYKKTQAEIFADAGKKTDAINKIYRTVGTQSDAMYAAMKTNISSALDAIEKKHKGSYDEILRAQAGAQAKINALNQQMTKNPLYEELGIRSVAAIEAQKAAVVSSYETIRRSGAATSQDLVNIEHAKNEKLKALNKEMVGDHEMSMASMMRAVLRFYAAYYVVSTGVQQVFGFVKSGIEAIDSLKISTIAVAAQITNMQTGDIAENYKEAVKYAEALNLKLMEIDANSFSNYNEIQLMNRAMAQHEVFLDLNNNKQLEAFTAISNTVSLLTTEQDKEKQASQEIEALMSGQVRRSDRVAKMIDNQIKQGGIYKNGLKDIVRLGEQHGDTLERIAPYLKGINAASTDISTTWEAVKSSLITSWGIIERGLFKDLYKDLVTEGRKAAEYTKKNSGSILKALSDIYNGFKLAATASGIYLASVALILPMMVTMYEAIRTGTVLLGLQVTGLRLWNAIVSGPSVLAITTFGAALKTAFGVFAAFFVGWEIGTLLNKFEVVRKAGVNMVYGIMEAWETFIFVSKKSWEDIKTMAASAKALFTTDTIENVEREANARWTAMQKEYTGAKAARKKNLDEQLKDVTDEAIKEAKVRAKEASTPATTPGVDNKVVDLEASKAAETEAKRIVQIRKDALEQMRQDIIKNNELIDGAGKSQYEKDVARINAEAAVYLDKSKDMVAVNQWKASAMTVAEAKESGRRRDIAKQATKDYKTFVDNEEAFAIDKHKYAINKILRDEQHKYDEIKRMMDEGGMTPGQGTEADALVHANTLAAIEAENQKVLEAKIDFYAQVTGYENEYRDLVFKRIDQESKKFIEAENDKVAARWAAQQKAKFDVEVTKKSFDDIAIGSNAMSGAFEQLSRLYDENSAKRKELHDISMAFAVAEKAAMTGMAIVEAVTAIAHQASGGDVYTAIARVAAMAALMAATLSEAEISFSGGGASASSTASQPTSTALGAEADDANESIANAWGILQDTYDMEYQQLSGIYNEMQSLNQNISGLVASIVKTSVGGNAFQGGSHWTRGGSSTAVGQFGARMEAMLGNSMNTWLLPGISKLTGQLFNWTASFMNAAFGGGKTSTIVGAGIELIVPKIAKLLAGVPAAGFTYQDIKTTSEGGWIGSDESWTKTQFSKLNAQTTDLFNKIFVGMGQTLVSLSGELGADAQKALDYSFGTIKINLLGMSSSQIDKAINTTLSNLSDKAIKKLFGDILSSYQQVGEGLTETAIRIVTDKAVIIDTLEMTNQSFTGTAKEVIAFSEELINMAGDLDALRQAAEGYYDKFFTDAEKQTGLQAELSDAMANINQALPATRDGYRNLIEGLDLTIESGKRAYITLMQDADAADSYYSHLEEIATAQRDLDIQLMEASGNAAGALAAKRADELDAMDESLRATQRRIWVLQDQTVAEETATKAAQDALSAAKQNLSDAQDSLKAAFAVEKTRLTDAYNAEIEAMNSRLDATKTIVSDLKSSVDMLSSAKDRMLGAISGSTQYSSAQADLNKVLQQARGGNLGGVAGIGSSIDVLTGAEPRTFSSAEDYKRNYWRTYNTISELQKLTQGQLTTEEATVSLLQTQIDDAKKRHEDTLAAMDAQMNTLLEIDTNTLSIAEAIRKLAIAQSAVAGITIPTFAEGGYFGGGLRIVGENGPELELTGPSRILSNRETKDFANNVILISEIRALRDDIKKGNYQIARNTLKTSKILDDFDRIGMPLERI